jgi:hypothetical protein
MIKSRILRLAHGILEERAPAEDRARARAAKKEQHAYTQAVRSRCRELRELRYCGTCHLALDVAHSFCGTCNNATEPLPAPYALEYARAEFPDLVRTREDFDRLLE